MVNLIKRSTKTLRKISKKKEYRQRALVYIGLAEVVRGLIDEAIALEKTGSNNSERLYQLGLDRARVNGRLNKEIFFSGYTLPEVQKILGEDYKRVEK